MKSYLHKQYLYPAILFNVSALLLIWGIFHDGISLFYIIGILGFLGLGILSVMLLWKFRHTNSEKFVVQYTGQIIIDINEDELVFPVGYYFRQSTVHKEKHIPAARINELNVRTFPTSIVIDNREVIFLKKALEDQLREFAVRNNIPISERPDIWGDINEAFLDTEFTEEEKARIIARLAANGVPPDETAAIRKKIRFVMYLVNSYAWEWVYFGQFDYLKQVPWSREKYWWSMEIALRNYHPKE